MNAVDDLSLNHRLAQGTYFCGENFVYSSVVGGLYSLILREGPKAQCHLLKLLAGAHCAGPRGWLASLLAKHHYPLQSDLECLANWKAVLLQAGPVNRSLLVVVPMVKQLLLQASNCAPN